MSFRPRGWQTLPPGSQSWHAIMPAAQSHSLLLPSTPSTAPRSPASLHRGSWGWSVDSGFPTTGADHSPRPLAQLLQDPGTAVGSPGRVTVCLCMCVCTCVRTFASRTMLG